MVESTLNYLADLAEKPYFYLYEPPPGTPWRNTKGDRRSVAIHDARELVPAPSLDEEGFLLTSHETSAQNLYDPEPVRRHQRLETDSRARGRVAAGGVRCTDHPPAGPRHVRSPLPGSGGGGLFPPLQPGPPLVLLLAHASERGDAPQVLRLRPWPCTFHRPHRIRRSDESARSAATRVGRGADARVLRSAVLGPSSRSRAPTSAPSRSLPAESISTRAWRARARSPAPSLRARSPMYPTLRRQPPSLGRSPPGPRRAHPH